MKSSGNLAAAEDVSAVVWGYIYSKYKLYKYLRYVSFYIFVLIIVNIRSSVYKGQHRRHARNAEVEEYLFHRHALN